MQSLGFGDFAKQSTRSPFREDKSPSWGIFQRNGRWHWKDFATGDSGDEITFIAQARGLDAKRDFVECLKMWTAICGEPWRTFESGPRTYIKPATITKVEPEHVPDSTILAKFGPGTIPQLARLAALRGIHAQALSIAQGLGFLVFGVANGLQCFGVTDSTKRALEIRRLDGEMFATGTPHKSHSVKGSQKRWPLGITEAKDSPCIALVEGLPDFLSAIALRWKEGADTHVAPVAMLGSSADIHPEALPLFKGKRVRLFPHNDKPGAFGAYKWAKQLRPIAARLDCFDFGRLRSATIKDLNDLLRDADRLAALRPILPLP